VKKTIKLADTPKEWDAQALYDKAELYAERMLRADGEDDENALWSALALELLARAALANISPVLLADANRKGNIEHAVGLPVKISKFKPSSIGTEQVFERLNSALPGFVEQHKEDCVRHVGYRNAELHSGDSPFDVLKSWEGPYYQAVEVLLKSLGFGLEDFIGEEKAKTAKKQIRAHADKRAQAVKKDIAAAKKRWAALNDEERSRRSADAEAWATRQAGHRTTCPACGSTALVTGEPVGAPERTIDEDVITETQVMLPHKFECIACGLKISGLAKLQAVDLGEKYKNKQTFDPFELYSDAHDPYAGYEDDNNEPF
jgi:hypothetical protein